MQNQNNLSNPTAALPKEIQWQALEFPEYKKHPLWFIGLAALMGLVVVYGILTNSWSTIIAFTLFGILSFFYASKKPETITVKLDGKGISLNRNHLNFAVIKKFWVIYSPPDIKVLYLETSAYINHTIKVELGNQDPRQVKAFLKQYLEEDLEGEETFADVMARKIKF